MVACPGSGKTRVLVERAARLRRDTPSAPIALVTFTREAAREIRSRLARALPSLDGIRVATFHAFALQQLMAAGGIRICSPSDQVSLMRRAWLECCAQTAFSSFQATVESLSCGGSTEDLGLEQASAYDRYLELLLEFSAVDFAQAILRAVSGMGSGEVRPVPCRHLLVDEVQDIDAAQLDWLDQHVRAGALITAVGDDDQAIYGFRHSLGFQGMGRICRRYSTKLITLSTNYRSHSEILSWATRLIGHNRDRLDKTLSAHRGPGGAVLLHDNLQTDLEEAALIALHAAEARDPFAVIARTNRHLDVIAAALVEREVPFDRPGRKSFWASEEPALFLALLAPAGLSDPITRSTLMVRYGSVADTTPPGEIQRFRRQLALLRGSGDPRACIDAVAEFLLTHSAGLSPTRVEGAERAVEACRRALLAMPGSLEDRLARTRRPAAKKAQRVVLLTMHGAKGLEFHTVWVAACQAGVVPHDKCEDQQEERRLFYVAMTRAETVLHLSFSRARVTTRRTKDGEDREHYRPLAPSPFLLNDLGIAVSGPDNSRSG